MAHRHFVTRGLFINAHAPALAVTEHVEACGGQLQLKLLSDSYNGVLIRFGNWE